MKQCEMINYNLGEPICFYLQSEPAFWGKNTTYKEHSLYS